MKRRIFIRIFSILFLFFSSHGLSMSLLQRFISCPTQQAECIKHFLTRPYLEIPGRGFPCQKKSIVNAWLFSQLKRGSADEEVQHLATLANLMQTPHRAVLASEKTFRQNVLAFFDTQLSNKDAKRLFHDVKEFLDDSYSKRWLAIAAASGNCPELTMQEEARVMLNFLREHQFPIVTGIYIGSPTLDDVMQHRFQYVYRFHFDREQDRFYCPPGFNQQGNPLGEAPVDHEPAMIFHIGLPNQVYRGLTADNFHKRFSSKGMPSCTPIAKLNLPELDIEEFVSYAFELMNCKDNSVTEPGFPRGCYRYPMSLYHFSFAPRWPGGGQEHYLGKPLRKQSAIEFTSGEYRENYAEADFSPLEIYSIYPNFFLGELADIPGYEFRLTKKGRLIKLRLVASRQTVFADRKLHALDKEHLRHPSDMTNWDWDLDLSGLFVYEGGRSSKNKLTLDEESARYYFGIITNALKMHLEINFCLKTRYLIDDAGISLSSFEQGGILHEDNAFRFFDNTRHLAQRLTLRAANKP